MEERTSDVDDDALEPAKGLLRLLDAKKRKSTDAGALTWDIGQKRLLRVVRKAAAKRVNGMGSRRKVRDEKRRKGGGSTSFKRREIPGLVECGEPLVL